VGSPPRQRCRIGHAGQGTASPDRAAQHNLPRERTPLFGRDGDVRDCLGAIATHRLTTILGIGGTGKTRLAARIGRECVSRFGDDVWFVDLIPLTDVNALETGIANTIGLALEPGPTRPQLIRALEHRDLLLILDNCEHMRDETADLLDALLEYTRSPRFLTTSRDAIGLADEFRFALEPLATSSERETPPAVKLFRATAQRHGVKDIANDEGLMRSICMRLDGLPLAIELAAAQLRHLSLEELEQRLNRRFELLAGRERSASGRQSNLLGVLEDTWAMLRPDEISLLGQLSAFPEQFQLSDVEEILDAFPSAAFARPTPHPARRDGPARGVPRV
jgi:predicted ATPase